MIYLTGNTASRGGLMMSEIRLWPTLKEAMGNRPNRWSSRVYEMRIGGFVPKRINPEKLGFSGYFRFSETAAKARKGPVISDKDAHEMLLLHETYKKHEWTPFISDVNFIVYCPACKAFGIKTSGAGEITYPVLCSDINRVLDIRHIMEYVGPEKSQMLLDYIKAIGYGSKDPALLQPLEAYARGEFTDEEETSEVKSNP